MVEGVELDVGHAPPRDAAANVVLPAPLAPLTAIFGGTDEGYRRRVARRVSGATEGASLVIKAQA